MSTRDISGEHVRLYKFPDGEIIRIEKPVSLALNCDRDGQDGHVVVDEKGTIYQISAGWRLIQTTTRAAHKKADAEFIKALSAQGAIK